VTTRGCALLLAFVAGASHASAYMYSEDVVSYRASLGETTATEAWDVDRDRYDIGCTSRRTALHNQLEYGYSYYYNLFGRLGLTDSDCGPDGHTGLSDLNVGVRGRLNPYMNFRSWELDVTIPLAGREGGRGRVGCGVFGVGAAVDRSDHPSRLLSVGYGAGLKFWEPPLAHRYQLRTHAGGPFVLRSRWSWLLTAVYEAPLNERPVDPAASIDDCGTQSEAVRVSTDIKYRSSRESTVGCGYVTVPWGRDVSRSGGFTCAFTRTWH
jgi:hypothetical protein